MSGLRASATRAFAICIIVSLFAQTLLPALPAAAGAPPPVAAGGGEGMPAGPLAAGTARAPGGAVPEMPYSPPVLATLPVTATLYAAHGRVAPGALVTYSVTLTNTGATPLEGLALEVYLPAAVHWLEGQPWSVTQGVRTATASLPLIPARTALTRVFTVLLVGMPEGGTLEQTVAVMRPGARPVTARAMVTVGAPSASGSAGPAGGGLASPDGRARIDVPAGAVTGTVRLALEWFSLGDLVPAQAGRFFALRLEAADTGTGRQLEAFRKPVTLTLVLGELVPAGERFYLLRRDPASSAWLREAGPLAPDADGLVQMPIARGGDYAGESAEPPMYDGWRLQFNDAQVDAFSGAATYAIPLDLPRGRNGLTPQLSLAYNSRRVDGILSWIQTDWTGLGWSIDPPQITRKITPHRDWAGGNTTYENEFTLILNGATYELMPESPGQYFGRYHSKSEDFLYIDRRNARGCAALDCPDAENSTLEYWVVHTRDGTEYRFGFTQDSEQTAKRVFDYSSACANQRCGFWQGDQPPLDDRYAGETQWVVTYRWRLDRVRDTAGNEIVYRYVEESDSRRERASYLDRVDYTRMADGGWGYSVLFLRGERGADGIRDGDLGGMDMYFWQSYYLSRVEVRAYTGLLVRAYQLQYGRTRFDPCLEQRRLEQVTVLAADGSSLPSTSFTYRDYHNKGWNCSGCSEWARTSFAYDRLIGIDNGYGGAIALTYAAPEAHSIHVTYPWNFHVTSKTLSSSLGEAARVDYAVSTDWDDVCYDALYFGESDGTCEYWDPDPDDNPGGHLAGFRAVTETLRGPDGAILALTRHVFRLNDASDPSRALGREIETSLLEPGGALLARTSYSYGDRPLTWAAGGEASHFIYLAQTDRWTYDGGVPVQTRLVYDGYDAVGNLTHEVHYSVEDAGRRRVILRTVAREYLANTSPDTWIVDRLSWERVFAGGAQLPVEVPGTELAMTAYGYDGAEPFTAARLSRGRLTTRAVYHTISPDFTDPTCYYATRYTYDPYGNLLTVTDALGNPAATYVYDDVLHAYQTRTINALGHTAVTVWDLARGLPLETHDPNDPDGHTAATLLDYDRFGRLSAVAQPGDTLYYPTLAWAYDATAPGLRVTLTRTQTSGAPAAVRAELSFYDGLGRLQQTRVPLASGTQAVTNYVYDARGQIAVEYAPAAEPASAAFQRPADWTARAATRLAYDALGRVVLATAADGTRQGKAYRGLEVALLDPNSHMSIQTYSAWGELAGVREYAGEFAEPDWDAIPYTTTSYRYDALGNLVAATDAGGHRTDMAYNPLGWKVSASDPNTGMWTYDYDALGRLTRQTDALGRQLYFAYDALGRLTRKGTTPGGAQLLQATYDDAATYGVGRRRSLQDGSGAHVWSYDARGRVVAESRTVSGVATYAASYAYNAADQLVSITYPTGETVATGYDAYHWQPATLAGGAAGMLVTGAGYNARGQQSSLGLGNGVQASYAYADDAAACAAQSAGCSLRLARMRLATAGGATLFSQSYSYDPGGNLTGLVDTRLGTGTDTLAFSYDALDRLTSVTGSFAQSYAYDPRGNLTRLGDRSYVYADPAHPDAVTLTTDSRGRSNAYTYDAAGNMIARHELSGTQWVDFAQQWTTENQLAAVTGPGGATWTQRYDGDGLRVGQVGPDGLSSGYFLGGLFEDGTIYAEDLSDGAAQGWSVTSGTWGVQAGEYVQTNAAATGLSYRMQAQAGAMTYSWQMRFVAGSTAGLNLGSPTLDRRNSYLVRQDESYVRVYRARDGVVSELARFSAPNAAGQRHSYQVTTEPALGKLAVSRDGVALGAATDRAPIQGNGLYLYLVTVSSQVAFDDLRAGQLTAYYALGSQRVAMRRAGVLYYLHGDHLGSTSLVTCGTPGAACGGPGAVVAQARYAPFGEVRWSSGTFPTDYRFAGQRYSAGLGLVHSGARWYSPSLGRWASADAIVPDDGARLAPLAVAFHEPAFLQQVAAENADVQARGWFFARTGDDRDAQPSPRGPAATQALNRYAYAANAPMQYVDPSGHDYVCISLWQLASFKGRLDRLQISLQTLADTSTGLAVGTMAGIGGAIGGVAGAAAGGGAGTCVLPVLGTVSGAALLGTLWAGVGAGVGTAMGYALTANVRQVHDEIAKVTSALQQAQEVAAAYGLSGNFVVGLNPNGDGTYTFSIALVGANGEIMDGASITLTLHEWAAAWYQWTAYREGWGAAPTLPDPNNAIINNWP